MPYITGIAHPYSVRKPARWGRDRRRVVRDGTPPRGAEFYEGDNACVVLSLLTYFIVAK